MVKRFFHRFSLRPWANGLAVYGQGRLWQEVWHQAQRSRWAEAAAAVAFFWLLGWLGGGFVALHLGQGAGRWLPPGLLGLARSLQMGLAIADADPKAQILGRWAVGLIGLGAWLCLVTGTQRLVQVVALIYGSPARPPDWRTRLLPWGLTLLGLGVAALVFSLVGQNGAWVAPSPARWLERLGRWVVALGCVGLGLALGYRLVPRRWVPGLPLGPGVRLVLALGLTMMALRHWGVQWLARQGLAYDLLLALGLSLVTTYGLILLVPLGAQVNLSALRYQRTGDRPWTMASPPPPPPSFDSFKIKRRE
jgi:uncharacterized BrkB/YihY/UPF0761 family membrane protein